MYTIKVKRVYFLCVCNINVIPDDTLIHIEEVSTGKFCRSENIDVFHFDKNKKEQQQTYIYILFQTLVLNHKKKTPVCI